MWGKTQEEENVCEELEGCNQLDSSPSTEHVPLLKGYMTKEGKKDAKP